jgi:hypothetical protein
VVLEGLLADGVIQHRHVDGRMMLLNDVSGKGLATLLSFVV